MAGGYDGEIVFKTKIDDTGFNAGTKDLSKQVNGIGESLKALGRSIGGIVGNLVKAIRTVVFAIGAVMAGSIGALFKIDNYAKGLKDSLAQLKVSFAMAFEPLVTMALPYIQAVVNWLIKAFNTVQMIVAALFGQKTYMQAIANTTDSAAKSAGNLAKNTKKAGEAAEGALAAFDELNVLQMEKPNTEIGGGGGGTTPAVTFKEVPIDSEILNTIGNIKNKLTEIWDWIADKAKIAKDKIIEIWGIVSKWFMENIWNPLVNGFTIAWNWIVDKAIIAWNWIQQAWKDVKKWFKDNVTDPLDNLFTPMWNRIIILANNAWATITFIWSGTWSWFKQNVIDPISVGFYMTWNNIIQGAANAWENIKRIWGKVSSWFKENVIDPISVGFYVAFNNLFSNISNLVKGIINTIIDNLNGLIRGYGAVINGLTIGANAFGKKIPGWIEIPTQVVPQIPRLATGAVIPPNAQFAAILGDQRSGKNIEAPENLIRQIIQEEMGGQQSQRVTIDFGNSSMGALIRALNPVIKQENDRIGSSLIDGVGGGT